MSRTFSDFAGDFGYIYVMACRGYVKIGKSISPRLRRKSLQTGSPFAVRVLKHWPVSSMAAAEDTLHCSFGAWRVRGEWFALPAAQRAQLISIRDLDSFVHSGDASSCLPKVEVPPIPNNDPITGWGIASPRSTIFHRWHRQNGKVVSVCGAAELSAENYWRLVGKTVAWTARHRSCEACEFPAFHATCVCRS